MMRRIICGATVFCFVLLIIACGGAPQGTPQTTPPAVTVTVTPSTVTTLSSAPTLFTANVSGPSALQQVTWSVVEGSAGGSITSDGLYTAPEAQGVFHVKATSVANSAIGSTALVTVGTALPPVQGLWSIWGSSTNDVWAVGDQVTYHWDGSRWHSDFVPSRFGNFVDHVRTIWGSGPGDIWQAGSSLTVEFKHWNGASWSDFPPNLAANAFSIWGSGPNDVWAMGGTASSGFFHWDGNAWTFDFFHPSAGASYSMEAAWGIAPNDVWAVGGGDDTGQGLSAASVFHWDGTAWTQNISGLSAPLLAVWGTASNNVWTVGFGGLIAHWDGNKWTPVSSGTAQMLQGIWGSGANDIWAVGTAGTVLHWDGTAWLPVPGSTLQDLHAIWGSGPSDIWVVGEKTILHLP